MQEEEKKSTETAWDKLVKRFNNNLFFVVLTAIFLFLTLSSKTIDAVKNIYDSYIEFSQEEVQKQLSIVILLENTSKKGINPEVDKLYFQLKNGDITALPFYQVSKQIIVEKLPENLANKEVRITIESNSFKQTNPHIHYSLNGDTLSIQVKKIEISKQEKTVKSKLYLNNIVLDSETKQPLNGIRVQTNLIKPTYTNKDGGFSMIFNDLALKNQQVLLIFSDPKGIYKEKPIYYTLTIPPDQILPVHLSKK